MRRSNFDKKAKKVLGLNYPELDLIRITREENYLRTAVELGFLYEEAKWQQKGKGKSQK